MNEFIEEQFHCDLMRREVIIVREMLTHEKGFQKPIGIDCKFMPSCDITTHHGSSKTPDYSKCVHSELKQHSKIQ